MSPPKLTTWGLHPRTVTRIVTTAVVCSGFVIWFHEPFFTLLGALASPGGLSSRQLTLFLLALLSALVPLLIATALADALYNRYIEE